MKANYGRPFFVCSDKSKPCSFWVWRDVKPAAKPECRRVITQSTYDISSRDLLNELQWNSLSINRDKQKAIFMFKTLNGLTPQYLEEMFSSRIGHYTLRDSNRKLFIPKPNTDYLKRSFSYSGAFLWNSLPESLRLSPSLTSFKTNLEHLYSNRL